MKVLDAIIDVWAGALLALTLFFAGLMYIVLIITCPVWVVPYLVIKRAKRRKGAKR